MSKDESVSLTINIDTSSFEQAFSRVIETVRQASAHVRYLRTRLTYQQSLTSDTQDESAEHRNARITDARDAYYTAIDAQEVQ